MVWLTVRRDGENGPWLCCREGCEDVAVVQIAIREGEDERPVMACSVHAADLD